MSRDEVERLLEDVMVIGFEAMRMGKEIPALRRKTFCGSQPKLMMLMQLVLTLW